MERVIAGRAARVRAVLVWSVVTTAAVGTGHLARGPVLGLRRSWAASEATFADLLVGACAVAALVAVGGLWLAATAVLRAVYGGATGRVGVVRAALLGLCGAVVLSGPAARAAADPADPAGPRPVPPPRPDVLAGLPLPDRPTDDGPAPLAPGAGTGAPTGDRTVVVRPGDTLWSLARARLGPGASAAELTAYWRRIHAANAGVIGTDPDLIRPGQVLRLPRPLP